MPNTGDEMYESHSMPTIAPSYPEGPVRYQGDGVVASYPIDERTYRDCIPEPLEPTDTPACQLMSIEFTRTSVLGSYRELIVALPTKYEKEVIAYAPFLFATGSVGTAAGREVYGAPKVDCKATFSEYGNEVQRVYTRGDIDVLSVTMTPEREVTDWDELPMEDNMKMACWKRIPSAVPDKPPAVDRIVTSLLSELTIEWAWEGPVNIDITKTADTPLHLFEPVGEPSGYRISFSWLGGEHEDAILHTYDEYNPQEAKKNPPPQD